MIQNFGHRPIVIGNYRSSTRQRFNDNKTKWLWPINGEKKSFGSPQKFIFLLVVNFTNVFHQRMVKKRLHLCGKKLPVRRVHFCGQFKRSIGSYRNINSLFRPFFWRHSAKKGKILSFFGIKSTTLFWNTVINIPHPVREG